jgi:hypothetical protein
MDKRNFIIFGLGVVIAGLLYFGKISNTKLAEQSNLLKATTDTLHTFKTTIDNQGVYISTLVGDKDNLISVLSVKAKDNQVYQSLIDSLKKDKHIQSASVINTETKIRYKDRIDTVYKDLDFSHKISNKWYDANISIKNDSIGLDLTNRDIINLKSTKIDNKGWFTGSTLTTYTTSQNPYTNITGLTSISTVVDKRKIRISPSVIIGINTDLTGKSPRLGFAGGVGISF